MAGNIDLAHARAVATDAAIEAAEILRRRQPTLTSGDIRRKPSGELVTTVDIEVEKRIRERLRADYPDHDILGEELGLSGGSAAYRWYVDPIDGTTNFSRGSQDFSVSIALATAAEDVLVGVIAWPQRRIVYYATRGHGAYEHGQRLRVSTTNTLQTASLLWCVGHDASQEDTERLKHLLRARVGRYEWIGSAALECAAVASGHADGYVTTGIRPWDIAAGILLVTEAGGRITDHAGRPYRFATGNLLASNGNIHEALVAILNNTGAT